MMMKGDPVESYYLLKDTLNERNYFLQAAPYLIHELPLLIPSKSLFWTLFWYFPGSLGYHLIYLKQLMKSDFTVSVSGPKFISRTQLARDYAGLKALHGQYGSIMSEAQMSDSRMNLQSLFTAAVDDYIPGMKGATLANYVEMTEFTKGEDGRINGVVCRDKMDPNGKPFPVKAKVVVNCAGVHADEIRIKDLPEADKRIVPSRGTHLMFKKGLLTGTQGMIVPETSDGRLLFIINYYGHPMVGTTDEFCDATHHCGPSQEEIDFICSEIKPFFGEDYDFKANLISAWAGLRPLVKERSHEKAADDSVKIKTWRDTFTGIFQSNLRWVAFKLQGSK